MSSILSMFALKKAIGSLHLPMITNCIIVVDSKRGKVERQADVRQIGEIFFNRTYSYYKDIGNENKKIFPRSPLTASIIVD